MSIRVPKDAGDRLRAAQKRTGKSFSDIGEALVTWYGDDKKLPVLPGKDPVRRPSRGRRRPRRR
jgi:hypothetical protein